MQKPSVFEHLQRQNMMLSKQNAANATLLKKTQRQLDQVNAIVFEKDIEITCLKAQLIRLQEAPKQNNELLIRKLREWIDIYRLHISQMETELEKVQSCTAMQSLPSPTTPEKVTKIQQESPSKPFQKKTLKKKWTPILLEINESEQGLGGFIDEDGNFKRGLRQRRDKIYTLPSLNRKLRKGDPFTSDKY